jgi:hypothetical protein
MRRLAGFFADRMGRAFGQDGLIRLPEVSVGTSTAIGGEDCLPQALTGCRTPIPNDKANDLPSAAAQCCPQPLLVKTAIDKRPQFIQFQNIPCLVANVSTNVGKC